MKIRDLFAKKHLLFLSASLFAFQMNVRADEEAAPSIQMHGFSTLGYSRILQESNPNSLGYGIINKSGTTLYNSILGLNLSYAVNEKLTIYSQLTGAGTNFFQGGFDTTPYALKIDMAMLNYHPFEWIDVRIGRQIMPLWMVSEQIDVGVTYPWIRPPMEVYSLAPNKSANGIGVDLKHSFFDVVDAKLGGRYGDGDYKDSTFPTPIILSRYFVGYIELNYNNMLRLRSSYGNTHVPAQRNVTVITKDRSQASSVAPVNFDTDFVFTSFGGTLDWNNFLLMAEYASTDQKLNSADTLSSSTLYAGPTNGTNSVDAWYTTAAYHAGDWTPHFTYSHVKRTAKNFNYSNILNATYTNTGLPAAFNSAYAAALKSTIAQAAEAVVIEKTYTLGVNYNFSPTIVGKAQWEQTRTNDAPSVSIINGPVIGSNDIINIGELAVSFVF